MVWGFFETPPPAFVNAVDGDDNQNFIVDCTRCMILFLGAYVVLNYLSFESFEHGTRNRSIHPQIATGDKILEASIRFVAVALIGLKILKWKYFDDAFVFIAAASFVLAIWHIFCGLRVKLEGANLKMGIANFFVSAASVAALIAMHQEKGASDNAMQIFAAVIVCSVFLLIISGSLVGDVWRHSKHLLPSYFTNWD